MSPALLVVFFILAGGACVVDSTRGHTKCIVLDDTAEYDSIVPTGLRVCELAGASNVIVHRPDVNNFLEWFKTWSTRLPTGKITSIQHHSRNISRREYSRQSQKGVSANAVDLPLTCDEAPESVLFVGAFPPTFPRRQRPAETRKRLLHNISESVGKLARCGAKIILMIHHPELLDVDEIPDSLNHFNILLVHTSRIGFDWAVSSYGWLKNKAHPVNIKMEYILPLLDIGPRTPTMPKYPPIQLVSGGVLSSSLPRRNYTVILDALSPLLPSSLEEKSSTAFTDALNQDLRLNSKLVTIGTTPSALSIKPTFSPASKSFPTKSSSSSSSTSSATNSDSASTSTPITPPIQLTLLGIWPDLRDDRAVIRMDAEFKSFPTAAYRLLPPHLSAADYYAQLLASQYCIIAYPPNSRYLVNAVSTSFVECLGLRIPILLAEQDHLVLKKTFPSGLWTPFRTSEDIATALRHEVYASKVAEVNTAVEAVLSRNDRVVMSWLALVKRGPPAQLQQQQLHQQQLGGGAQVAAGKTAENGASAGGDGMTRAILNKKRERRDRFSRRGGVIGQNVLQV